MSVPQIDLGGCRQAHTKLFATIAGLTDDGVSRPSLLADWTVGHVLSHLARNAGATRTAEAIVADVTSSAQRLDAQFTSIPVDQWSTPELEPWG